MIGDEHDTTHCMMVPIECS